MVMFGHTGGNGEDVRVEDDVLGIECEFFDKNPVSAFADGNSVFRAVSLPLFVECHDDDRCAVTLAQSCLTAKLVLAFLEADGIHDRFALHVLQACLDHVPARRVDHDRHS